MAEDPPPPPKRRANPLAATVADPILTDKLAKRVRRDVALESAEKSAAADGTGDHPPVDVRVVLGPDGVPQLAEEPEAAPETVRVDSERLAKLAPKK